MPIHILAFHSGIPLYGRNNPPKEEREVRLATIASVDRTMRSAKLYLADGKKAIVRALEQQTGFVPTLCSCSSKVPVQLYGPSPAI